MSANEDDLNLDQQPLPQPGFLPQMPPAAPNAVQPITGPVNQPQAPPKIPEPTRNQRMVVLRNLLANFVYSLGTGLSASAATQGTSRQRTMAGVGASLQAPFMLEEQQRQQNIQNQRLQMEQQQLQLAQQDRELKLREFTENMAQRKYQNAMTALHEFTGMPAPEEVVSDQGPRQLSPEDVATPTFTPLQPTPAPYMPAPVSTRLTRVGQGPLIDVPGYGSFRPPTAQELTARALAADRAKRALDLQEKLQEPIKLSPDEIAVAPGRGTIAEGKPKVSENLDFLGFQNFMKARNPQTPEEYNQAFLDFQKQLADAKRGPLDVQQAGWQAYLDSYQPKTSEDKAALYRRFIQDTADLRRDPNLAAMQEMMRSQLPTEDQLNLVADQVANYQMSPSQLKLLFSMRGQAGQALVSNIYLKALKLNHQYSPEYAEAMFKYGMNPALQTRVRMIDNIANTIEEAKKASDSLDKSRFPVINRATLATLKQMGDPRVSTLETIQQLFGDELGQIFAGGAGSVTSDAKIAMGQKILDQNLGPAAFKSTLDEIGKLLKIRKNSLVSGTFMEKPIQNPVTPPAQTPPPGTTPAPGGGASGLGFGKKGGG